MAYETPRHLGRFQAASPFQSQESLDSRRGWAIDSAAEHLRNDRTLESNYTTVDVSGSVVPADDEAYNSGDYGSSDVGSNESLDSSWE